MLIVICSIVLVIFNPKAKAFSPAMIFGIAVEDRIDTNVKPNVDKSNSEMNILYKNIQHQDYVNF